MYEMWFYIQCSLHRLFKPLLPLNDGLVAIRSGRLALFFRKAGPVVPVDVAPNEPLSHMRWLREKPVQVFKASLITER